MSIDTMSVLSSKREAGIKRTDAATLVTRAMIAFNFIYLIATDSFHMGNSLIYSWMPPASLKLFLDKFADTALDPKVQKYAKETMRYDYEAQRQLITIRNPTPAERSFKLLFTTILWEQLTGITNVYGRAIPELRSKKWTLSTYPVVSDGNVLSITMLNPDPININVRSPDSAIYYSGAYGSNKYPAIILEVGQGTKARELPALAKWYIEKGKGYTKAVVGVELGPTIAVTLWKAVKDTSGLRSAVLAKRIEGMENMRFCSHSDSFIHLGIGDVIPDQIRDKLEREDTILQLEPKIRLAFRDIARRAFDE